MSDQATPDDAALWRLEADRDRKRADDLQVKIDQRVARLAGTYTTLRHQWPEVARRSIESDEALVQELMAGASHLTAYADDLDSGTRTGAMQALPGEPLAIDPDTKP